MRVFANQYCFISCPPQGLWNTRLPKIRGGGGDMPYCVPHRSIFGRMCPPFPNGLTPMILCFFLTFVAQFYKVEPILRNTRLPKIWGGATNALLCAPPLNFFGGTCLPVGASAPPCLPHPRIDAHALQNNGNKESSLLRFGLRSWLATLFSHYDYDYDYFYYHYYYY